MAESVSSSPDALYIEPPAVPVDHAAEETHARKLADRYELEFVDLVHFHVDHALFRSIPADLMLRYGFVPYRRDGQTLLIVVSDPILLICDEPTGDLDRQSAGEVLTLLQLLNRDYGKTVVMVTHDMKAAEYARHTLYLEKGTLVESEGTMAHVLGVRP